MTDATPWDIRVPDAPAPPAEQVLFNRGLVAAEHCQRENWVITPDTMVQAVTTLTREQAKFLLDQPKFQMALRSRGINADPMQEVSVQQKAALSLYFASSATMAHASKLKMIGVTPTMWAGWLKQPAFAAAMEKLSDDLLDAAVPLAKQRLFELVDGGNVKALDRVLAWRGGFDYRNPGGGDLNQILSVIFQILDEEHVPDATMVIIANRVRSLGENPSAKIAPTPLAIGESE